MEEFIPPFSPGRAPVALAECIQELLKFLLSSSISDNLEIDLGFSKDYCSSLLKDDTGDENRNGGDVVETSRGVPLYPLDKQLASSLHQWITTATFVRATNTMSLIQEDELMKEKLHQWNELMADKGPELVKMLKAVNFELHVQEPFFSQLRIGQKTVEGRCAAGDYNQITPGAFLLINKCLLLEVQLVKWYASFLEMIEAENLGKVLPGVKTIEEGVKIYRKFYTEEKEKSQGVLAICVSRPAAQPYISMASIISVEDKSESKYLFNKSSSSSLLGYVKNRLAVSGCICSL